MRTLLNRTLVSGYLLGVAAVMIVTGRLPLRAIPFRPIAIWREVVRGQAFVPPPPPELPPSSGEPAPEEPAGASAPESRVAPPSDELLAVFRCPRCGGALRRLDDALGCDEGHAFPIHRGVPRFVDSEGYVESFGFEWNQHPETQLDSARGDEVSAETFRAKTGFGPEDVRDKLVLDAGVGTGRFSEVVASWGGRVIGVDLSLAVEAAARNLASWDTATVVQADIGRLPFEPDTFDVVFSIGVLHHTSDTRAHFERLASLVKPGGAMAVWVYPRLGDYVARARWIPFTSRIPSRMFHDWCRWFVPLVRPYRGRIWADDLCTVFPFSSQEHGLEWDVLDTFDGFSPRYHWIHDADEVRGWFEHLGFERIRTLDWPTAVQARKPA